MTLANRQCWFYEDDGKVLRRGTIAQNTDGMLRVILNDGLDDLRQIILPATQKIWLRNPAIIERKESVK